MDQASLTVEELLQLPVLQNAQLVSGANGLQNEIRYIDVMEIPDLAGWLRPHEFVLTTGYAFQNNPYALGKLLDEMHKAGGAAVGVKQRRFGYQVSAEARHKSDSYAIPIIDIPPELTTIDITHSVMEKILNRQFVVLNKARAVNSELMKLLLRRRSAEIVTMIGNLLHCCVAVLNAGGSVLNATPGFDLSQVAQTREIRAANTILGYLVITEQPTQDDLFAQMCLDQATTALALEFTIQDAAKNRKEHAREEFLVELLSAPTRAEEALLVRAQRLDFPYGLYQFMLVVQPIFSAPALEELREDLWEQIHMLIVEGMSRGENGRKHLTVPLGESFAVLCVSSDAEIREAATQTAEQLYTRLQQRLANVEFSIGIGSIVNQLSALHESYSQARHAVEAGRKVFPARHIVHYEDVYIEDMLLSIGRHPALKMMYDSLLLPLCQYDQRNGTELLKTLEALLRHGGNTREVAEELYIHRNSVSYRLERIQDILQVNIFAPEIHIRLDLLMRAWKLQLLPLPEGTR